ncbi:hypothetical protein [Aeromonas caviae]|uniref:hypothetical protein n=1 Tax=Aeromonas caviae TaxID=648 RepID=UPI0029D422DC|nr:hypothetical protein [Aeromonas caviae]MDX7714770.1 hypothetical protein [Aeromonas caviae]MDX7851260.1 hypothetical protein [Aeromonas caviae]
MHIKLYQRNYRDDLKQAIQQEHAGNHQDAALSYKKAQHHATSANMQEKARFAMARRIHCLKQAKDPEWREVNIKFQQLYKHQEHR